MTSSGWWTPLFGDKNRPVSYFSSLLLISFNMSFCACLLSLHCIINHVLFSMLSFHYIAMVLKNSSNVEYKMVTFFKPTTPL